VSWKQLTSEVSSVCTYFKTILSPVAYESIKNYFKVFKEYVLGVLPYSSIQSVPLNINARDDGQLVKFDLSVIFRKI